MIHRSGRLLVTGYNRAMAYRIAPQRLVLALVAWAPCVGAAPAASEGLESPNVRVHEDLAPTGPSLEERLAEIHARVQRAATYPPIARVRAVTGETLVEFHIDPDGTPRDVQVKRSSGSAPLDRAAERAVHDAAPLPRIIGSVRMPVRFQLTSSD